MMATRRILHIMELVKNMTEDIPSEQVNPSEKEIKQLGSKTEANNTISVPKLSVHASTSSNTILPTPQSEIFEQDVNLPLFNVNDIISAPIILADSGNYEVSDQFSDSWLQISDFVVENELGNVNENSIKHNDLAVINEDHTYVELPATQTIEYANHDSNNTPNINEDHTYVQLPATQTIEYANDDTNNNTNEDHNYVQLPASKTIEYANDDINNIINEDLLIRNSNGNSNSTSDQKCTETCQNVLNRKKREPESNLEFDKKEWRRSETKKRRMLGESYVGYRRENKIISHDVEKDARKQAPTCKSKKCQVSRNRFCDSFDDKERQEIFKTFWEHSWAEKKTYVVNMVERVNKKRETVDNDDNRRNFTLEYYLRYGKEEKKQVCKQMFLGTLGIKEWMVTNWVKRAEQGFISSVAALNKSCLNKNNVRHERPASQKTHLKDWLEKLPKLQSHYCRKDTKRLYLEGPFQTKKQIFNLYESKCDEDNVRSLKRTTFFKIIQQQNISIFMPRKDQCDTCTSYNTGQINKETYNLHVKEKDRAREEKDADKKKAKMGECMAFTMDLQSVNLCPKTNASAPYYAMKLKVYNFTIFNLGNTQTLI